MGNKVPNIAPAILIQLDNRKPKQFAEVNNQKNMILANSK